MLDVTHAGLTPEEQDDLAGCELVIERGRKAFVEVGAALGEIRDRRLYRETHGTFEDYCQERWSLTRQHVNRLVAASAVVLEMEPIGSILPATESQARALAAAPEAERAEVWQEAVVRSGGEAATARVVADVIKDREAERYASFNAAFGKKEAPVVEVAPVRDGDEWYTRADHVGLVRDVLGAIDLDPASCGAANTVVGASEFFTQEQDGLAQPWVGRVFLNPPYSNTGAWVEKLVAEFTEGAVTEAILLVNAKTDTAWFERLWDHTMICFVRGRVSFTAGDGGKSQTGFSPSVFAYFGRNHVRFAKVFAPIGRVVEG